VVALPGDSPTTASVNVVLASIRVSIRPSGHTVTWAVSVLVEPYPGTLHHVTVNALGEELT
jgi:hypothetical protein